MKTTIAEARHGVGRLLVIYDDEADKNPYRVYQEYYAKNKDGYTTKHRRQITRYADMDSCMYLFWQVVGGHKHILDFKD